MSHGRTQTATGSFHGARVANVDATARSARTILIGATFGAPTNVRGYSLRAGFATSAARAGKADRDIMRQMGSRSRAVFDRYVRAARLWDDNTAAGLL